MSIAARMGGNLYYKITGTGTDLLFVPGLGDDHATWNPQIEFLRAFRRCIAFDPPGCGESHAVSPDALSIPFLSRMALALLDNLEIETCAVVATSLGGLVALELVASAPQRVSALVLHSTWAQPDRYLQRVLRLLGELYRAETIKPFAQFAALVSFSRKTFEARRELAETVENISSLSIPPEVFRSYVRAGLSYSAINKLEQVKCPTLIICGEEDVIAPPRFSKEIQERIPGSSLEILPLCGHAARVEEPDYFNKMVLDFLSR